MDSEQLINYKKTKQKKSTVLTSKVNPQMGTTKKKSRQRTTGKTVHSQEKNGNQNYDKMPLNPPDQQTWEPGHAKTCRRCKQPGPPTTAAGWVGNAMAAPQLLASSHTDLGTPFPSMSENSTCPLGNASREAHDRHDLAKANSRNPLRPHDEAMGAQRCIHGKRLFEEPTLKQ